MLMRPSRVGSGNYASSPNICTELIPFYHMGQTFKSKDSVKFPKEILLRCGRSAGDIALPNNSSAL